MATYLLPKGEPLSSPVTTPGLPATGAGGMADAGVTPLAALLAALPGAVALLVGGRRARRRQSSGAGLQHLAAIGDTPLAGATDAPSPASRLGMSPTNGPDRGTTYGGGDVRAGHRVRGGAGRGPAARGALAAPGTGGPTAGLPAAPGAAGRRLPAAGGGLPLRRPGAAAAALDDPDRRRCAAERWTPPRANSACWSARATRAAVRRCCCGVRGRRRRTAGRSAGATACPRPRR